ncbi:LCP family protein [Eggerthella sinensis]|uniref:LCP family protein n=1 Tax=Eggerthella sinensis TaxID=242230 RepID=UPI00266D5661|nr:LCP family protein [Eggerthella sinensis]
MVNKRKQGFTQTRSKLTSRRMRTATVGTHVPRRSSRYMNGESMGFSSPRKQKRASRGIVDTILPTTASGESSSQYARRVSRREFTQDIQRKARIRRILVLAVCLVVVACVAVGVGVATFFGSLDGKLALKNSDASSALIAPKTDAKAYYTLVSADLDLPGSASAQDGPDAFALVRVDQASRTVTVVSIPPTLQVSLKDGKTHPLRDAQTQEGDASLITAVSNFAGVDVAHYVKTDAEGIAKLVDALGGIEVNVAEEVDDPNAGDAYLPAGTQVLDGAKTLTLLRASNFADGLDVQTANQRAVLTALSLRLLGDGSLGFLTTLDGVAGAFQTDLSATAALSIADAMRGMDASTVYGALVPGYETTRDDVTTYVASTDGWKSMMELVESGAEPVVEQAVNQVDPGSFTITVRNGSGVTGGANQIADTLKDRGFDVTETGNTDTYAYDETLVVYNDDAFKDAAETVVSTLGMGRTVAGAGFYTFDTDVLVVLGKDWKPTS